MRECQPATAGDDAAQLSADSHAGTSAADLRLPVPTLPVVSGAPQSGMPATPASSIAPIDTSTPGSGAATITVTFDSGPNAGTYSAAVDPGCSYGVLDDGTWAAQYGNLAAGATDLSTVQVQIAPDTSGKSGKDYITSVFIVVGPIFGGTNYTVSLDRFSTGDHAAEIDDQGATATIHVRGKSTQSPLGPGGILIDLTVSCPTVNRG